MNHVITSERIPIKLWLDDLEPAALTQAKNLANLPFAFHHIAIMPDAHRLGGNSSHLAPAMSH